MSEMTYYPLTHPQLSIWYMEKMFPDTSISNIAATLRFKGVFNPDLLEQAINIFIQKNDSMRIRVSEECGDPKQYVSKYEYQKLDFIDFSQYENPTEELFKWDQKQTLIPFKTADSQLFYYSIIKISDNDGGFYIKIHHLISDAVTMTLMGTQIAQYYSDLIAGKEIFQEMMPSYIDYIKSEEEYKKSDRFLKDKEYWNTKFETLPEITALKKRTNKQINPHSKRKTLVTPTKFTKKLREYCQNNSISPLPLFLSALAMYINRVSSKEDIVLGTPILNRSNRNERNTTGMFIGTVPVRINVDSKINFKDLSQLVSKDCVSLLRHQKYTYDLLLKDIREKNKVSHNLFDIVLSYQNTKFDKDSSSEEYTTRWHCKGYQLESLMIHINDREDEGHLIIDYDFLMDLYHVKEIEFMHQHIISLLWHAIDNPDKVISNLDMLPESEKDRILYEFNNHNSVYSKNKCLSKIFKDSVSDNTKCYILDGNLNPMPIGVAGELYIDNENLLSNSEFVRNEVVSNPFDTSGNLIRTGIIARWYPNGEILYLGKLETNTEKVCIAATFTSEPVGDYIKWWGSKFGYNFEPQFAGYNQVFQELLSLESMLSKNKNGINVILIRLEDFIRNDYNSDEQKMVKLQEFFNEIKEAINKFENIAPLITVLFPVSTHLNLTNEIQEKISELNAELEESLSKQKNSYVLNLNQAQESYRIEEVFDRLKDKEGHMPFTDEYYAVVGTEIARKICAIKKQHFKVIALDCDNSLWRGICGEQGTLGVKIDGAYRKLQEFMLQKYNEGMLLTVCTKNNEKDVFDVFETNPEMVLNKNHIINWKINWKEKSENIKEIARELNLGLDSFIFIDDNPIECSKMVENCPEVLTLQLPSEEQYIPMFLDHVWALDRVKVTKEDALRSSMYQAEKQRSELMENETSLDEFMKNLQLRVSMRLIDENEIERAAQLTQRTNQFNLSTIRRTEKEIEDIIHDDKTKCFVIEASDKFGDYGIVGLVILIEKNEKLFIDTFLLSCRILGRKVEDVILSGIKKFAKRQDKTEIEAKFVPTQKNKPVLEFIENQKWAVKEKDEMHILYFVQVESLPESIEHIDFYFNKKYKISNEKARLSYEKEIYALDHIAISVKNLKESETYYKAIGYEVANSVYDSLQNSHLSMCISNKFLPIELVAPENETSPSYNIAEIYGEFPYHLCYKVSNIKAFLEKIKNIEFELISDEKPAILFNNQKVAFIMVKRVGLIELVETGVKLNSKNRKYADNTIKIIVNDFERAVAFYKELGYSYEKGIKDTEHNLMIGVLIGCFGEKIELISPISKESEQYEFLKHHGAGIYQIQFEFLKKDDKLFVDTSRKYNVFYEKKKNEVAVDSNYNLCDTNILEGTIHKQYILPLSNFTGKKLLQLPVYQGLANNSSEYKAPTNEIEEKLSRVWEEILKIKKIGIDDDFFDLGGDSLHAIQLQVNLLKYNWNLTTQDIYKHRTIRQQADVLMNIDKNDIKNAIEDNYEESLGAKNTKTKITSLSQKDMEYDNILLIGATGYLGAHVLVELLTSTKSNIYCLVRGKANNNAKERLKDTLKFYFGDECISGIDNRVSIVSGDITLEYFGLKQSEYEQLQKKIDAVVHSGAVVNYYGNYSDFEEVNIKGTEKVIKFCSRENKPLFYVSTMGISGQYLVTNKNEGKINLFTEDDLYIGQNYYENPYVRSKYETEILVNNYIKKGANIAIFRVGNLTGRFSDGQFQKNISQNAFYNIIKSIISIGAVSKNILNEAFDFTPVDHCSKAIVKLMMKSESMGRTFHLFNHNKNDVSLVVKLLNNLGFKIKCLDKDEFKHLIKIISSNKSSLDNLSGIINDFNEEGQLKFHTSVKLDSEFTVSYLKQLDFEWSSINLEYMKKIINYMKQVKYIS